MSGTQAGDAREGIETPVEAHDSHRSYAFHDRKVNGVPRREVDMSLNDRLGSLDVGDLDGQYLIHHTKYSIEGRLDGVSSLDSNKAVQDLLKHLSVRYKPLAVSDGAFEQALSVTFVRMGRPYEVHRDI